MKLRIALYSNGGELDSRIVEERRSRTQKLSSVEQEAADAAVEMIRAAGELHSGDLISVAEVGT